MSMNGMVVLPRSERTRQVAFVLWVTLILNWTIALLKLIFGFATQCMVIVADGVHSFSDGTSNIVGLVAIHIAGHPADRDHPYGHQKYETLAAVVISFFLFVVSFGIIREAIVSFARPKATEVSALSFILMGATFLVNLFVVWYERKKGKLLESDLLLSDSWHTMTDLFITLTVVVALVGISFHVPHLDSIFSIAIATIIVVIAVRILKRGSDVLVDKAVIKAERIEGIVRRVSGVKDCHEIRTRGRLDDVYVDLHVLVDNEMTVMASHKLANIIEHNIRQEIPSVHDVVVHIEPVSHDHREL